MRKGTTWGMLLVEDAEDLLEWIVYNGEHLLHETPDLQTNYHSKQKHMQRSPQGRRSGDVRGPRRELESD